MPSLTPVDASLVADHVLGDPVYSGATVHALLAALPSVSHPTTRLRRAVLLRHLAADPVSESSLDALQLLASLPATGSPIAAAHIAVAAFLAASAPDFDAAARALFARPDGRARRAVDEGGPPALASDEAISTVHQFEAAVGDSFSQTILRGMWGNRDAAEERVTELIAADWAAIEPSMLMEAAHRIAGDGAVETWRAADEDTRAKLRILVGEERSREILSKLEEPTSGANPVPTPAVDKVIDPLKTSCAEPRSVVEDPLPAVKADGDGSMVEKSVSLNAEEGRVQPTTCSTAGLSALNDKDKNPSRGKPHSLMDWNPTARTFQWESLGSESSESSLRGPDLPSPSAVPVSPRRRRARKWCLLEEETLRKGVEQYGRGNWKDILNNNPDVFIGRTLVDLKDKWRNMNR